MFFFVSALAQILYGAAPLLCSWNVGGTGIFEYIEKHQMRAFYIAGIAGNIFLVALYAITRTFGILVGPDTGEIETFTLISLVSKGLEIVLVGCLILLWTGERKKSARPVASRDSTRK